MSPVLIQTITPKKILAKRARQPKAQRAIKIPKMVRATIPENGNNIIATLPTVTSKSKTDINQAVKKTTRPTRHTANSKRNFISLPFRYLVPQFKWERFELKDFFVHKAVALQRTHNLSYNIFDRNQARRLRLTIMEGCCHSRRGQAVD